MLGTEIFKTERITDIITRVRMPGNVFGYIAVGSERAAVIDTGFGVGPYREFVEQFLNGKPYVLILTHGHFDHSGAASQFDEVYMDLKDLDIAREHTQKKIRAGFMNNYGVAFEDSDIAEPMEDGYLPLQYGQRFDLGNEVLEIVCLGGHTPGRVGILFENERILLAGDACCSFTLMFGGKRSLTVSQYRDNLIKAWNQYHDRFDTMLYSHPHNYGGPEVMTQMIALCDEILAGKDDRVPLKDMFGQTSYVAKKENENHVRPDGKIANLQYAEDCAR